MDLKYSADHIAFQKQVRDFLAKHGKEGKSITSGMAKSQRLMDWQALLMENGYAARSIPKEYGGYGATPDIIKSRIIAEEFTRAGVSMGIANQGVSMLVPTLLELGNEEQKKKYIEPTLRGAMVWCQGYSEPGSGSDLASLKTHAVEDGDDFIINGQKIWTSTAHLADMMFCLVRTEPEASKHAGISYLLIPMSTPGIQVRPLVTMTGHAEFNEVFFTDVRVAKSCVVGKRGEGWYVANATLNHERGMLGDPNQAETRLNALVDLMQRATVDGESAMDAPVFRARLIALQGRVLAMKYHGLRLLTSKIKGHRALMAGLVVKLNGCQLNHDLAALALDVLGEFGLVYDKDSTRTEEGLWRYRYMFDLGLIIGGGTAQIQKNIISERGLSMARSAKKS